MTKLSVNLNKVALLRNQRDLNIPDVVRAAHACIDAGAPGITVHPRPDGRHIRTADVLDLAAVTRERGVELNVEGYPSPELLALVRRVVPTQCTLVPDAPGQRTSDHGWDVAAHAAQLRAAIGGLSEVGVRVSLFVDADDAPERTMESARAAGADRVELYTEPYARAFGTPRADGVVGRYARAARAATDCGLGVNAGHDLNLDNLGPFVARVPAVLEVSIGHALIADALFAGLPSVVRAYLALLSRGPSGAPEATR